MSIELTTVQVGKINYEYNGIIEQGIDCDVTLPDYCPDIMRILNCFVKTDITDTKLNGDRASADGTAKIGVIYADENNNIFSFEHEYPFSKFTEIKSSADKVAFSVCVNKAYANCRAVSKRRIDIHGAVSMLFTVCNTKSDEIISNAVGDGIQTKKIGVEFSSAEETAVKVFQISEVESLSNSNQSIGKIICTNASPILNETKIIRGKALLKGEICVNVVYSLDAESNETATTNYTIPFNEIAELESLTDKSEITVELCTLQTNAEPKADNDGSYKFISLNISTQAKITAYEEKKTSIITDAYSTQCELNTEYNSIEFYSIKSRIKDTIMCKQLLDISTANPKKIYAVIVNKPEAMPFYENDRMILRGKIPVGLIVVDENGVPSYCEREAEFEYSCLAEFRNPVCNYNLTITGYNYTLSGDSKADFRCEIAINATVGERITYNALTAAEGTDGECENRCKSSVVIYFCSGDESVWDIARKYNTTVEDIMDENGLTDDYLQEKTMLMIPVR